MLNHFTTKGSHAGRDLQAGHLPHSRTGEAIDTVSADLRSTARNLFSMKTPHPLLSLCAMLLMKFLGEA